MTKYQKRHYEDIAQLISSLKCVESLTEDKYFIDKKQLIISFANLFSWDNSNFDEMRFVKECEK